MGRFDGPLGLCFYVSVKKKTKNIQASYRVLEPLPGLAFSILLHETGNPAQKAIEGKCSSFDLVS